MSLSFPHRTTKEIRTNYNAFGLLWLVPIYLSLVYDAGEGVWFIDDKMEEANWVPKPLYWLARLITILYASLLNAVGLTANIPVLILRTWETEDNAD